MIDCECTYPTLLDLGEKLLLFYRKQTNHSPITRSYFVISSYDHGHSWTDEKVVIEATAGTWIYAMPFIMPEKKVGLFWGQHGRQKNDVQDVFYAQSNDMGLSWQDVTGSANLNTLSSQQEYLIHQSKDGQSSRVWDIQTTENGQPATLWIDYNSKDAQAYYTEYRPEKLNWVTTSLGENSQFYYPCGGAIDRKTRNIVYVASYDSTKSNSRISVLEIAKTGEINQTGEIAQENSFFCRPMSLDKESGFDLLFTDIKYYDSFMKFDTSLLVYKRASQNAD